MELSILAWFYLWIGTGVAIYLHANNTTGILPEAILFGIVWPVFIGIGLAKWLSQLK